MALVVSCECGERIIAEDDQAGQQVPCPACGKSLTMPEAYNPLSMAKYAVAAPQQESQPIEDARPLCPDCDGTGHCPHCHGSGTLSKPLFDRITSGITDTLGGVFSSLADMLGAGPGGGRRVQTRSERRRANGCPNCEASGKCFKCEGSGRFVGE